MYFTLTKDQVDEEMARALAMSMDQDDVEMTDADKKKLKKEDQK